MNIAVLTPTIPERADLLERCRQSVRDAIEELHQTGWDSRVHHLVLADYAKDGTGAMLNQLERMVRPMTEWVVPLADDDELRFDFLVDSLECADTHPDADVVWSWPEILPRSPFARPMAPPAIPATALVRRSAVRKVGGWPTPRTGEDRALWELLVADGATFVETTPGLWTYHLSERSKSNAGESR